jgi:hypothetical protein
MVIAATLVAELGDITRFANPRQLMAYVGLVPSEHSGSRSRRQSSECSCRCASPAGHRRASNPAACRTPLQDRPHRHHDHVEHPRRADRARHWPVMAALARCIKTEDIQKYI